MSGAGQLRLCDGWPTRPVIDRPCPRRIKVLSNVSSFHSHYGLEITRIGRGMALTMLVAHWGYLSGSVLHMLDGYLSAKEDALHEDEGGDELSEASARPLARQSVSARSLARQSTMNQFLSASEVVHKGKKKLKEVKNVGHHAADSAMETARKAALAAVDMSATAVDTVASAAHTMEQNVVLECRDIGKRMNHVAAAAASSTLSNRVAAKNARVAEWRGASPVSPRSENLRT